MSNFGNLSIKAKWLRRACLLPFVFCLLLSPLARAESNLPGDIGDYGVWATDTNHKLFIDSLSTDFNNFSKSFSAQVVVKDYVPIEAKVGSAFIHAFEKIGAILEKSLYPFIDILLIILFAFWLFFEGYQLASSGGDVKKFWKSIVWKIIVLSLWLMVLSRGPAEIFMWLMGPIISFSSALSDLILNSITTAAGAQLPDTCAAIHNYAGNSVHADILCVPTRLSGFFYICVAAGFRWMAAGIGTSLFAFIAGAVFVILFIQNIYKFAVMALGVIADLFIALLMLPFAAVSECFGMGTTYKGLAGNFFSKFVEIFQAENLEVQVKRFINAAIYFISISLVIAICVAVMKGFVDLSIFDMIRPSADNDEFMTTLIAGCLVAYLANKAGDLAGKIGGRIDDAFGKQIDGTLRGLWKNTFSSAKGLYKAWKGDKKK